MKEEILLEIKLINDFDGTYYEKYLEIPIYFEGKELVRVTNVDGEVLVHALDLHDNSEFILFDNLKKDIQLQIYADICGHKICDLDDFFEWAKDYLDNGDKIIVRYELTEDGEEDYENRIYSVMNSCDEVIFDYSTLTHLFKTY